MPIETSRISDAQAQTAINFEEGQFADVKSMEISPANLTKTISAFANTEGGDLYIGVAELGSLELRNWDGFAAIEDTAWAAKLGHYQALGCHIHDVPTSAIRKAIAISTPATMMAADIVMLSMPATGSKRQRRTPSRRSVRSRSPAASRRHRLTCRTYPGKHFSSAFPSASLFC